MSDDWYRSEAWDEEAQYFFEEKIARARDKIAFYLWVKARAISQHHPVDSDALFQRSLDCDDEFEAGRALNAWGTALAQCGDIDGSLDLTGQARRGERHGNRLQPGPALWR